MNKKKIIPMLVSLVLVAIIGIGATLAYFTDEAALSNTVTMGKVGISLVENPVIKNEDGNYIQDPDQQAIKEGLTFDDVMPGETLPKNPTVLINSDSEDSYIRTMVTVKFDNNTVSANGIAMIKDSIKADMEQNNWNFNQTETENATNTEGTMYFYYPVKVNVQGYPDGVNLFKTVTIPSAWDNSFAKVSFSIAIKAQAVQAQYLNGVLITDSNNEVTGWNIIGVTGMEELNK